MGPGGRRLTEILTESFCERCGTRYTFESTAPRKSRLGRARVLSKGVRNFVLSDDASFSEAMAEARSEVELSATSHQLDAFHQTFNFCLTCRQYTCGDCWNQDEGRCLTCAPIPGMELPAAEPGLAEAVLAEAVITEPENGHVHVEEAWPDADLSSARLARAMGTDTEVEAVAPGAAEPGLEIPDAAPAALVAGAAQASADDEPPEPAGVEQAEQPAAVAADPVSDQPQLIGVAPGQSLEEALAQYEARLAIQEAADAQVADLADATADADVAPVERAGSSDAAPAAVDEAARTTADAPDPAGTSPVLELAPAIEADAEPLPAPEVAAAATPTVETAAPETAPSTVETAEPEPAETFPVSEPAPVAAEPALDDVVPQPTWPAPIVPPAQPAPPAHAPETPAPTPWLTVAPEDSATEPQWPTAPQWQVTTQRRDAPSTLAGRPLLPQADPSGLWAASAREVLTAAAQVPVPDPAASPVAAAQPCVSCGLSLSANARFCRRCGTRQG